MRIYKHLIVLLLCAGFIPLSASAQSKAETSLYKKTVGKFSLKQADKFLSKYPQSVYAPKVQQMKDSVLYLQFVADNVSLLSKEDALGVAGAALDAVGWKQDGKEHVLALDGDFTLRILSPQGQLEETRTLQRYSMEETPEALAIAQNMSVVTPFGPKQLYVYFTYRNGEGEYVEALYRPQEDILSQALFYGTPLGDGRIEGQSPELMEGVQQTAEIDWLAARLKENPSLEPISKADLLTDASIRWWLKKNPKAATAAKLGFGQLDAASSLVEAYRNAPKEKGKTQNIAVFDLRGYTVIVAGNKKGTEYSLIWCEPAETGKYIRSYFFENDGTTLDVVYYKGKTTFKNKISLTSGQLAHLK